MVQLAIDHQGTLRGVHYHAASNTMNNVVGSIDTINEQVQWRLESNEQLWFQTPLNDLLAGSAQVQVTMPTGVKQWYLKRAELPAAEQE
jgi:dTDP-4-dehydrorhamnose 3,5-epimerase-like enzyme